jgi:hypothetical protein
MSHKYTDTRVVMCDECATTRTVAARYPISSYQGRRLRCAFCDRLTLHHTTDAVDDYREHANAEPSHRNALKNELAVLDLCEKLGIRVKIVPVVGYFDSGRVSQCGIGIYDGRATIAINERLSPAGRAIAIKRVLDYALEHASELGDTGKQFTFSQLYSHMIGD